MPSQMASSIDDDGSLVVSSNLTSTMKTLFEEKKRSEFPHVKNLKKKSGSPEIGPRTCW